MLKHPLVAPVNNKYSKTQHVFVQLLYLYEYINQHPTE
jgi:hypothetical protein